MPHTDRGPGLQVLNPRHQFVQAQELPILDGVFDRRSPGSLSNKEMHHVKVDLADFVGVVIDETDDFLRVAAGEHQLFLNLALHTIQIGRLGQGVLTLVVRIDVSADADALLGHEALLARLPATGVDEVSTLMMEDGVGDDLLVRRVILRVWPGLMKKSHPRGQDRLQITLHIRLKPLKRPEFIKERAGDHQDMLDGGGCGEGRRRSRTSARPSRTGAGSKGNSRCRWATASVAEASGLSSSVFPS